MRRTLIVIVIVALAFLAPFLWTSLTE